MSEFRSNIIFVHGGKLKDVQRALEQWIDAYFSQMNNEFVFRLYRNGPAKYVIVADEKLENDLFYFLVNYIKYPVGIDYKVEVEGFTTGTERNILKGKDLFVFLPEVDREFDYVLVSTGDGESYRVKFNGKITDSPVARIVQKPVFIPSSKPLLLNVPSKKRDKVRLEKEESIERRLKWMFGLFVSLHLVNFFVIRPFSQDRTISFENLPFFLSIGISLWLFWVYKVLQTNTRYLKCLGLVTGMLVYLIWLAQMKLLHISKEEASFAIFPLFFLLIQWPLRFVFFWAMNREPIVERRPQYFSDGLYSTVLILVSMFLSLILSNQIWMLVFKS